ncbi:hypothetical protein EHI42_08640 [Rhizobium hidalgonense]|uniref:hypothetical protein n=1 Tax=Rhizobium hidalgonense TaxID=1538159 RepID=UPI000FEC391E|nr:hypothetical protein [Rhizobium hidalgonense]RWX18272.1 hypothetical protein EHI42_08640 [Rhizobium hidalgonense]
MGGIMNGHVEWAVINRLKAMLDEPPDTKFNVTQTFALFSAVLLWTKNRGWVAGNNAGSVNLVDAADQAAHKFRQLLGNEVITSQPWSLPLLEPRFTVVGEHEGIAEKPINGDFKNMPVEQFVKWLRDAFGHGDGRTIRPLHKKGKHGDQTWLSGFRIQFQETQNSNRRLDLHFYDADMRRIGSLLADRFCMALADAPTYYNEDVATRVVEAEKVA